MPKIYSDRTKGIVAVITLAFVFASMGVFVRLLKADFTILQQTYLRIMMAFILGLFIFRRDLHFDKLAKINEKEWAILLLRSFSLYLLGVTLVSQAYVVGKFSSVSFVGALPMTAILGFILLKEIVTLKKVLYIGLGFIGVLLIAVTDYSHVLNWGQGELWALVASIFFSLSYVTRKFQSDLLNNKEIAVIIFGLSSIMVPLVSIFIFNEGVPHPASWGLAILALIFFAGLFNVANLFLTNYGFQKLDAVLGSNLLMLETVFAVMLGFVFFGEIPNLRELLGGVLIVSSAYLMNRLDT